MDTYQYESMMFELREMRRLLKLIAMQNENSPGSDKQDIDESPDDIIQDIDEKPKKKQVRFT